MKLTRAQIEAELTRRGVPIPNRPQQATDSLLPTGTREQSPQLSRAMIEAELRRRGVSIPQQEQMNPFQAGGEGFIKGVEDVTHGIMQPLLESGYLGQNIKSSSERFANERQARFKQAQNQSPLATNIGNLIGGAAISSPAYAATGGASLFSKAPGYLKYLQGILAGGTSGALTGAAQYVNPEESRLANASKSAALGAGLGALGTGAVAAKNAFGAIKDAFPAKKVAQGILDKVSKVEGKYKTEYGNLFKEAKDKGIVLEVPKIKSKPILEEMTKKESKYVRGFLDPSSPKYGNPKEAHNAASDLGKMIRRLDKKREGIAGLNSVERKALEAARNAQKKIRSSIGEGFESSGRPDLASKYSEITTGFGKDVIPYRTTPAINKFKKGELNEKDFLSALLSDKKFQAKLGKLHPELSNRQRMQFVSKYILPAGVGLGAANQFGVFGE